MTTDEDRPRRRFRARRLLVGLLLFELAYVVAFEWAARSGRLAHWINRRPEKISIAFGSAHSFLPFFVSVDDLVLHGQTPRIRWQLEIDHARAVLSPVALLRRTVRFVTATAEGGEFAMLREIDRSAEQAARLPPVTPLPQPETPRPPTQKPKWSFELPRVHATALRRAWLDGARFSGRFAARGGMTLAAGRELEVAPSHLDLDDVEAAIGDTVIGHGLGGSADVRIERYPFKERRGKEMLPFLSGTAAVHGSLNERGLLDIFLHRAPWLSFGDTPGRFEARLTVEKGELRPGTRVAFHHDDFETTAFQSRARGDARIEFEVTAGEGGSPPHGELGVRYDEFEIHQVGSEVAEIVGSGLTLVATTPHLELASVAKDATVKIDLGTARIPSLAVYNRLLPASAGLELQRGAGAVTGTFEADLAANDAHGAFSAAIEDVAVRYRNLDLSGDCTVDLRILSGDLEQRRFDVSTTKLELLDFRSPQAESAGPAPAADGWWARFELAGAELRLPPDPAMHGRFEVGLRDSVPIVGIFETRRHLPHWVERLLTVQDIRATGTFSWQPEETALEEIATRFRQATIQAKLRFRKEVRRGLLMIEWKKLAVGLRLENEKKRWKLLGVRNWYAKSRLDGPLPEKLDDDPFSDEALAMVELPGARADERPAVDTRGASDDEDRNDGGESPGLEVVAGSTVTGQLDSDPGLEAVTRLAAGDGTGENAIRLAALDLVDGRAELLGLAELPPGAKLGSLAIRDREVVAELEVAGEGDEPCCPSHRAVWHWRPPAGPRIER